MTDNWPFQMGMLKIYEISFQDQPEKEIFFAESQSI